MNAALRSLLAATAFICAGTGVAWAQDATKPLSDGCMIGGCSRQLCVEASRTDTVTTCEYATYYACFASDGECKRQPNGECGWTPTEALKQCITAKHAPLAF